MDSVLKRMSKTRLLSLLASRSTSRWRYLVSASLRPCHLSGSGRSALDRISRPLTSTESSPRRLVITSPVAPTQSPRSTSASTAAASAGRWSARNISCTAPLASSMVAKRSLPWPRIEATRPATLATSPVRVSGSSPECAECSSASVALRSNRVG